MTGSCGFLGMTGLSRLNVLHSGATFQAQTFNFACFQTSLRLVLKRNWVILKWNQMVAIKYVNRFPVFLITSRISVAVNAECTELNATGDQLSERICRILRRLCLSLKFGLWCCNRAGPACFIPRRLLGGSLKGALCAKLIVVLGDILLGIP